MANIILISGELKPQIKINKTIENFIINKKIKKTIWYPENSKHPRQQIDYAREILIEYKNIAIFSTSPFFIESLHHNSQILKIKVAYYFLKDNEIKNVKEYENEIGCIFEDLGSCLDKFVWSNIEED